MFHIVLKHSNNPLSLHGLQPSLRAIPSLRVVIPVSSVHRGMIDAVNFARSISDHVTAIYVNVDNDLNEEIMRKRWNEWFPDVEFVVVPSPYRSIVDPLLKYLDQPDLEHHDGQQAILVLPELIPARPWHEILHNRTADMIKKALLYQRRQGGFQRIIVDVPYHLQLHTPRTPFHHDKT